MKKKLIILLLLFIIANAAIAASIDTLVVRIKAMRCEDCAHKVSLALNGKPGVEGLQFDLEKRTVAVAYNPAKTNTDSICATLKATGRYKPSTYDPKEKIRRGMGLKADEMKTEADAELIKKNLYEMVGMDSVGPNLAKGYIFVRYDANKTTKATIREKLKEIGFTPVNYYTSNIISFAYFKIPAEAANDETIETVLSLDGVDDANVNAAKGSLAITYENTVTNPEKLLEGIRAEGIEVKK
jgi:copper chaperone CopZ